MAHFQNRLYWLKVFMALATTLTLLLGSISVAYAAVPFAGKGTKSSPFLVQTAEQLQEMQNNLSSYYKLSNTIDLAGKSFSPIGYLAKPFTGTFMCDLNSDGSSKYAIKNLQVTVNGKEGWTDYVQNNSRWEAALFGSTNGATITNIAVLGFTITNTVVGKNVMNPDWSKNPGVDEQASAGLIGIAKNTTITGCAAVGKITNSRNNHSGGLVGRLAGGNTVTNCNTSVTIQTTGLWCHGALAGSMIAGDTVKNSFASGDLTKAALSQDATTAGFIGSIDGGVIENCGSDAVVCAGGSSFVGRSTGTIKNSYAVGMVTGVTAAPKSAQNANNCYILNQAGCKQEGFTPATSAELSSTFGNMSGWKVSGALPLPAQLVVVKDISKYVPETVTSVTTGGTESTTTGGTQSSESQTTSTSSSSGISPEEFMQKMDTISDKANDLTIEQAYLLIDLKASLVEMSMDSRGKIADSYLTKMNSLFDKAVFLLIRDITERVEALPEPDQVTAENADTVKAVWESFQKMPTDVTDNLSDKTIEKLTKCNESLDQLGNTETVNQTLTAQMSSAEKVVVIVMLSLSALALAGTGIMIFLNIRLFRKSKNAI